MKFNTLAEHHLQQPDFSRYLTDFNPQLDVEHLRMAPVIGEEREKAKCVLEGENGLVVKYKNKPGAYVTMNEVENGEVWNMLQVQGARSKKSYRVSSGMHWPFAFANTLDDLSQNPESKVRHITLPTIYDITNLEGSASEYIDNHYRYFRNALRMSFSQEEKLFIRDVNRKK